MEEVSSIDEQVKLIAEQFPDSLLLLLSLTGKYNEKFWGHVS